MSKDINTERPGQSDAIRVKALFFKEALSPSMPQYLFPEHSLVNNSIKASKSPRGEIAIEYLPSRRCHKIACQKYDNKGTTRNVYFVPESWCSWEPLAAD